jgi:hypothetical protein
MVTRIKIIIFLIQLLFIIGCSTLKNMGEELFRVKDAYYQSWILNENKNGTNIVIELTDVKAGVVFDSVIFRGLKFPVYFEEKDGTVKLKSILNNDMVLLSTGPEKSDLPDMLMYHIRRLDMKYY